MLASFDHPEVLIISQVFLDSTNLKIVSIKITTIALYTNTIEETISDSSKLEKLSEDPTLKHKASLQHFLRKLKQKNLFNEIEYGKLYPSGSAPDRIYGTP